MPSVSAPPGPVVNLTLPGQSGIVIIDGQPIVVVPTSPAPIVTVTQPQSSVSVTMGTSPIKVDSVSDQILFLQGVQGPPGPQGPPGIPGAGALIMVWGETPAGTVDGSNLNFSSANPYRATFLSVFLNGLKQRHPSDYTETGIQSFRFVNAPLPGDSLSIDYVQP